MVRVIYWTCFAIKRDCLITDATNSESTRPLIPPSRGQIPRNQGFTRSSLFFFYHRLKISTILHLSRFLKKISHLKLFPFVQIVSIYGTENNLNYSKLRYTSTRSYVWSIIHTFWRKIRYKIGRWIEVNDIWKTRPMGEKDRGGILARLSLHDICSIFTSVRRKCVRVIGSRTMSVALVNGMEIRSSRGGHFPLVPANWLRSKLVIDWQHVPGRGQYTRVATRREPYWPTLVVPDVGTVYIFTATSRFIRYSPALFPWNGIASRVGERYIRPLVSYPKLRLDINIQFFLLTRPFHRPSFSNFFLRIFETNFRPREKI